MHIMSKIYTCTGTMKAEEEFSNVGQFSIHTSLNSIRAGESAVYKNECSSCKHCQSLRMMNYERSSLDLG